jgi:hypothetical protein
MMMKFKLTILFVTAVFVMGLLLGSGTAQADTLADVRVFVTKNKYDGDLGGFAGANFKCIEAAQASGIGGEDWRAWLSDNTGNAIDRIPNGEYRLLDDTLIALDKDDLITEKDTGDYLRNVIDINEFGEEDPGELVVWTVWTGTGVDGLKAGNFCGNAWSGNGELEAGFTGDASFTDSNWTYGVSKQCSTLHRLYCFGFPERLPAPAAAFLPGAVYLPLLLSP